jgi:hypothetical protein
MAEKSLSENLNKLDFPHQHQFVIIDTETDSQKAHTRPLKLLPMTFAIRYNGEAKDPASLTMLINPSNMSVQSSKLVTDSFTRNGYVIEDWGDGQDVLQFNGSIGGYYILNPTVGSSGLNRYDRSKSVSFKNLMNLFMLYRNNGTIYEKTVKSQEKSKKNRLISTTGLIKINKRLKSINESPKNRPYAMADMYLAYDNYIYKGSFDEFSIEEDASRPYTLNYSFTFVVQNRIEKDFRDLRFYTQEAFVFSDVQTYSSNFTRAVNDALETSRSASLQDPRNRR